MTAKPVDDDGRKVGDEVTYRAPLVVAADGNSTRLSLAMGLAEARRPADGRRRPHLLHEPAARRRLAGVLAGAVGRQARREQPAARLRLDLRRRRRHRQRRPRHPQHQRRRSRTSTTSDLLKALADEHARGVGLPRREPDRPDPRRGAADGLQPQAALHPRPAAGRRLRRHGQPVQRRGHRLRDGVRRRWPPRSSSRRSPGPTADARERALAGLPAGARSDVRRLLHARPGLREADRQPGGHEAGDPARPAAPDADAVHAQAAGQPHRPARRRRDGPDHQRAVRARTGGLTGGRVSADAY